MESDEVRDLVENLLAYKGDIQILEDWLIKKAGVEVGPAKSLCKTLGRAVRNYNYNNG